MQIINLSFPLKLPIINLPKLQIMAIGDFDGIHLGHQEVIRRTVQRAKQLQLISSIMTFHPHPRVVLGHEKYKHILTPLDVKMKLFEQLGVEYTYVVKFDPAFAQITPESFVRDIIAQMDLETVIVGFDFSFGYEGKGTPDTLSLLSHGEFKVEVVRPFHSEGEKVSSTNIRNYLLKGQINQANVLLGRAYSINGTVVKGEGRGTTIGFPTANIDPQDAYVLPTRGVYAVRVYVGGQWADGVMNIGMKPTFETDISPLTLEAHLFDYKKMIYDEQVQVEFIDFLRDEQKFASVDELIKQINHDIQMAIDIHKSNTR